PGPGYPAGTAAPEPERGDPRVGEGHRGADLADVRPAVTLVGRGRLGGLDPARDRERLRGGAGERQVAAPADDGGETAAAAGQVQGGQGGGAQAELGARFDE